MGRAFTPGLRAKEVMRVVRTRELPAPGEIFVKVGDIVTPEQVVGRALIEGDLAMLRIPEKLGLDPETVIDGLKARGIIEGRVVQQGEILCSYRGLFGLFRNEYASPVEGKVELVSPRTGHLGVRLAPRAVEVKAYLGGKVDAVVESRSVTISSLLSFVQGVFGVGGERFGTVKILGKSPDEKITPRIIPDECAGAILIGGTCPTGEALRLAASRGARGMVVGAIDDRALTEYLGYDIGIALTGDEAVSMGVIITEGFGSLPMSERIYSLLCSREGRFCSMNGATQVRAGAVRPELLIHTDFPGTADKEAQDESNELRVGIRVRLIRVPYFGEIGEVVALPHEQVLLETGAYARVLQAKLKNGEVVAVPRANVELVS